MKSQMGMIDDRSSTGVDDPSAYLTSLINRYITTGLPGAVLITGPPGSGKTTLLQQTLNQLAITTVAIPPSQAPETTIIPLSHGPSPNILTFDNLDLHSPPFPGPLENRLTASLKHALSTTAAFFIATATRPTLVHPALRGLFQHTLPLDALTFPQRVQATLPVFPDIADTLAELTPGFLWADMIRLFNRLSEHPENVRGEALHTVLRDVRPALLAGEGQTHVPSVGDLFGLEAEIGYLKQVLYAVFRGGDTCASRALQRIGNFRGVLIHGRSGCGKTALARLVKALLPEHSMNVLEVCSTSVVGSVVGEGERELRRLFGIAESIAPSVVIIDNIEIIAPRRGESETGKAFERVLSTLLVLIDGIVKVDKQVLVIGTTRDLRLVDGALLRPGRFDMVIEAKPPGVEARFAIVEQFLRQRGMTAGDIGIDDDFGERSNGWTAPEVLAFVRKRLQHGKGFI